MDKEGVSTASEGGVEMVDWVEAEDWESKGAVV